jgi:serine/threonine protein kinase
MGIVYVAEHVTSGERAAVKVLNRALLGDSQFRARFRREVETCRAVSGPHVASLVSADPDGEPAWLATSYIAAPTLAEHVAIHGPLDPDRLETFAASLLEGLTSVHAAGVLHRDLKPTNVLLRDWAPVIIDFGISSITEATALTATGTSMGSPGWMAPEQVRGQPGGHATDVFAWAAVVVFAATGRAPFGVGRPEALAYRVVHEEPDLDGVPNTLRPVLETALAKSPAARPSLDELSSELPLGPGVSPTLTTGQETKTRVERTDPTTIGAATEPQPARQFTTRTVAFVAAVVAVLAAALVTYLAATDRVDGVLAVSEDTMTTLSSAVVESTTTTSTTTTPPTSAPAPTGPPPTAPVTTQPPLAPMPVSSDREQVAASFYWSPVAQDCSSQPRSAYRPLISVSSEAGYGHFPVWELVEIGVWDKFADARGDYLPIDVVVVGPQGNTTTLETTYGPDWQSTGYVPDEEGGHTIVWFAPDGQPMACGGFEASLGA